MGSTILSAFILACILWIILRSGRRHAKYAMRRLASQAKGIFIDGGIFTHGYVMIHRGANRMHVYIRPLSVLGGHYQIVLNAPWVNRREILPTNPQVFCQSDRDTNIPGIRTNFINVVSKLESFPSRQTSIAANAQGFELWTEMDSLSQNTAIQWYEVCARFYDLILADTEPGLQFVSAKQDVNVIAATCQVCGTHPDPRETVLCDRCGAPHHAECWEYNGGCAIFGCKASIK